ncbi:MAG: GntR family transcriptional regulator [Roseivivax sp.]|nr:GntR family transcriptional regulator [Roseivivax sp.]
MAKDGGLHAGRRETDNAADRLRTRLLDGEFTFGQRLAETRLAQELGIGRGRVRETLRQLVGEGFLESIPNRGVFVREYSRSELLAMYRVREVLEGLAARMAAERVLSPAEIGQLEHAQETLNGARQTRDAERFARGAAAWHTVVGRLSHSSSISDLMHHVCPPLMHLPPLLALNAAGIDRSCRDVGLVTSAILGNAPDAAEAAMRAHVRSDAARIAMLPEPATTGV